MVNHVAGALAREHITCGRNEFRASAVTASHTLLAAPKASSTQSLHAARKEPSNYIAGFIAGHHSSFEGGTLRLLTTARVATGLPVDSTKNENVCLP